MCNRVAYVWTMLHENMHQIKTHLVFVVVELHMFSPWLMLVGAQLKDVSPSLVRACSHIVHQTLTQRALKSGTIIVEGEYVIICPHTCVYSSLYMSFINCVIELRMFGQFNMKLAIKGTPRLCCYGIAYVIALVNVVGGQLKDVCRH